MRILIFFAALAVCGPLMAGRSKPPVVSFRLHAEGPEREGPSFVTPIDLVHPRKRIFIKKVPVVTERDIAAIFPFSSPDGSLGCTLRLDTSGRQRVEEHTTNARDTIVVALINGRVGAAMRVDRRITDGIVSIPSGFLPEEILALQAQYPTIGEEKQFETQRRKALASLKKASSARQRAGREAAAAKTQTP
jgi:hypothetical protein